MVQPNYNPEEALQRVKLMMGYDSSKTLTENKQAAGLLKETQLLNEIEPFTIGLLAAAALGIGAAWSESSSEGNENKVKTALQACDTSTSRAGNDVKSRKNMSLVEWQDAANKFKSIFAWTLGGFGVGGGTDIVSLKTLLNVKLKGAGFGDICEIRKLYNEESDTSLESDLVDELNDEELIMVSNAIAMALANSKPGNIKEKDSGTRPVQWWLDTFNCLEVSDSFVEPISPDKDKYGNNYVKVQFRISGQIKEFDLLYNGRIYTSDTHKYTGKKVSCNGTKTTIISESTIEKKKSLEEQADLGDIDLRDRDEPKPTATQRTPSPTPTPRIRREKPKPKYPPCQNGRYVIGCSSEVVRQVQECLGFMVVDQDGKFGKITQAALQKLGFAGGFTDKDVEKICKKVEEDPSLSVADSFGEPDINPGS
jgi:hypothetical protein